MSGLGIVVMVVGYIAIGAAFTVSLIRVVDAKHEIGYDDCGYIAGMALVWPIMLLVLLFALFGRFLIKMSRKGGAK